MEEKWHSIGDGVENPLLWESFLWYTENGFQDSDCIKEGRATPEAKQQRECRLI